MSCKPICTSNPVQLMANNCTDSGAVSFLDRGSYLFGLAIFGCSVE